MSPPYTPWLKADGGLYFPEPYSLDPLPNTLHDGLIPVGVLATLSVVSTLTLICFICYRLVTWRLHYNTFLGYNQYVLLVLNLLVADIQQAAAFLVSFHWIRIGKILAPSAPCFGQAWLLHSGDVSSGFFVLAIAMHTYWTAVHGKRIGQKTFTALVVFIWALSFILTAIGLGKHGYEQVSELMLLTQTNLLSTDRDTLSAPAPGVGSRRLTRTTDYSYTTYVSDFFIVWIPHAIC